jgi:predicted pyridoxine 5'-phosphate oxidase superfamily flavin-nucleotide-binding protein
MPSRRSLTLACSLATGDPLLENLVVESHIALIAIDLLTSRRVRANGTAVIKDGAIYVKTEQVYGNCRRYIQERIVVDSRTEQVPKSELTRSSRMSPSQYDLISRADTFFIATDHPESGADVSHKGGSPGFVRIVDANHLAIPDYNGNSMFNTLGNIQVNPKAGLLFIDFEHGRTLQISGVASIDWDPTRTQSFLGAERVLDFHVKDLIDNNSGFPLILKFRQFSRFNPKST